MIITLGGHHGAGKSTLGARLAEHYRYKRYSTGDFLRGLAIEREISILDLNKIAETDNGVIDAILDNRQKELGIKEDNFIIDGRLAFHFIPHGIKIFLTVSPLGAAHRIFADASRQGVETHETIEHAVTNIETRRASENERYMKYYGLHIYDMDLYDIVIDTSNRSPDEVFTAVIQSIDALRK
jgi:CMP/dCMP kinase